MSRVIIHGVAGGGSGRCHDGPEGRACEACRTHRRKLWHARVERRRALLAENPDASLHGHGHAHTYLQWGCRCDACRWAANAERYRYGFVRRDGRREIPPYRLPEPFGREWINERT